MLVFIVYLFLNIDMTVAGIQKTANEIIDTEILLPKEILRRTRQVKSCVV